MRGNKHMSMVPSETILFLGTPEENVSIKPIRSIKSLATDAAASVSRYIGSKAWSFPGILLSTPKRVYQWATGITPSLPSTYQLELTDITPQELEPYLRYAAVNAATHTMDDRKWLQDFDGDELRFREVSSFGIDLKGLQVHDDKVFFDLETGLKATVAESPKEVIIAFGALDSLADIVWAREGGYELMELIKIKGETAELMAEKQRIKKAQANAKHCQGKAIKSNLIGRNPLVYEQAAKLVAQLKEQFPNKKISLTGQCFGGSLAAYAGLINQIPTRCFNSLPLGAGCQQAIGDDVLAEAHILIDHVSARTDWISDNRKARPFDILLTYGLGIRTPGNFGNRFAIPSGYEEANSTHDYMLGSILLYLMPNWRDPKGNNATRARPADFLKQKKVISTQPI